MFGDRSDRLWVMRIVISKMTISLYPDIAAYVVVFISKMSTSYIPPVSKLFAVVMLYIWDGFAGSVISNIIALSTYNNGIVLII